MSNQEKATLRDVLNYEPEQYLSEDEVALIRSTFKDNRRLIAVLRKVLLPTISDPSLPIEEMAHDAYLAGVDWAAMPADEIKPLILARSEAIKFVAGALMKLKVIANTVGESPYQTELRRKQDSAK
jgi:hypothetical protein